MPSMPHCLSSGKGRPPSYARHPALPFIQAFANTRVVFLTGEKVRDDTRTKLAERSPLIKLYNLYTANEPGDMAIDSGADNTAFELRRWGAVALITY